VIAAALLLGLAPADREVQVASFSRLRVEAPVIVTVAPGSPRARVAGDARAAERLLVRSEGGTLVVRMPAGGPPPAEPLRVTLSTPNLTGLDASGGARVTATGLKGDRLALVLAGAGSLDATAIDAQALTLVVAGNGTARVAGRAGEARLTLAGAGALDADALTAGDLSLSADGAGEVRARARYTARVSNRGAGQVTVAGSPKCLIQPGSTGPIRCGPK
jgi:hypothetical protein